MQRNFLFIKNQYEVTNKIVLKLNPQSQPTVKFPS